jgi:hypothetical protein
VVTRQWGNKYGNHLDYIAPGESNTTVEEITEFGTILRTPYTPNLANRLMLKHGDKKHRIVRKFLTAWYELAQFFLPVGTKYGLYREAHQYLKNNPVDLIIATGEPFVLFRYASKLACKYNIPWVADYRDPWVENAERSKNSVQKKLNQFLEHISLRKVSAITTVSDFFKHTIEKQNIKKAIQIIHNGYDSTVIEQLQNVNQGNEILTIGYAGMIYEYHPIEPFLAVVNQFITEKENYLLKIKFFGVNCSDRIQQLLHEKFPALKQSVEIIPKIPYKDVMAELSVCNILLLFNYYNIIGTKIFDYIALKRHILLCFENDTEATMLKNKHYPVSNKNEQFEQNAQANLITQTQAGTVAQNQQHLFSILTEKHNEFATRKKIACNTQNAEQLSRRKQTEKLAEYLVHIVRKTMSVSFFNHIGT